MELRITIAADDPLTFRLNRTIAVMTLDCTSWCPEIPELEAIGMKEYRATPGTTGLGQFFDRLFRYSDSSGLQYVGFRGFVYLGSYPGHSVADSYIRPVIVKIE